MMKRIPTLAGLKGLIKRYWEKDTQMWVVSNYYVDLCDNMEIHILMDEFLKTLVSRDEEKMDKFLRDYVLNAISYYD